MSTVEKGRDLNDLAMAGELDAVLDGEAPTVLVPRPNADGSPGAWFAYEEERLLAALALTNEGALAPEVIHALGRVSVEEPQARAILDAVRELLSEDGGGCIEVATVAARLKDTKRIATAGGQAGLRELEASAPSPRLLGHLAGRVLKASQHRQVCARVARARMELAERPADCQAIAEDAVKGLLKDTDADTPGAVTTQDAGASLREKLHAARKGISLGRRLPSGIPDLDRLLGGGYRAAAVHVVAARSSVGKSAYALEVALKTSERIGRERRPHIPFFSLEMDAESLVERMAQNLAGVPGGADYDSPARVARMTDAELAEIDAKIRWVQEASGIEIIETANLSANDIAADCRRRTLRGGPIDLIVIDYLNLISDESSQSGENEAGRISARMVTLQQLAKATGAPILLLAQFKRVQEAKPPQMDELKGSTTIQQVAETITFLYRKWFELDRAKAAEGAETPRKRASTKKEEAPSEPVEMDHGLTWLIVEKNRRGRTGTTHVNFDGALQRFTAPRISTEGRPQQVSSLVGDFDRKRRAQTGSLPLDGETHQDPA